MSNFAELGLAGPLLAVLTEKAHLTPTPIQAQAIPAILQGRDLIGIAQTGTGKTAAFALPILHRLGGIGRPPAPGTCRVLVLSPTRELAGQIADSFRAYGARQPLRVGTVFGGVPYGPQIRALARGLDVLVATPGRLLDHLQSGNIALDHASAVVLDEVDQMLDLGFAKAIRQIARALPPARQNLFFSATMPPEIRRLAQELLVDPVEVAVAPTEDAIGRIAQQVHWAETEAKREVLVGLLGDAAVARAIVFTRTRRGADEVTDHLQESGIATTAIHGEKSQRERDRALAAFRAGRIRVLVATDVAARGLHVDGVTHVVNFELPEMAESYVHRIGRTGRAGAAGVAISLCSRRERPLLRAIERLTRRPIDTIGGEPPREPAPRRDGRGPPRGGAPKRFRPGPPRRAEARAEGERRSRV